MYPLPTAFERAYLKSDTLVVEVNSHDIQPSDLLMMQEKGRYAGGDTIESHLKPDTVNLLKEYLLKEQIPIEEIRSLKPWLLTMTLVIRQITALGFDPALGIDNHFLGRARGEKRILQLETFSEQISLLADEPPEIQELFLKVNLVGQDETEETLKILIAAWREGDVDEMYRLTALAQEEHPVLKNWMYKLINERNRRMAEKIRGYLATRGTYLVIAGALHMGGDQGIISLLSQQYTVTQQSR